MRISLLALTCTALLASPAFAAEEKEHPECAMQEKIFVNVNFSAYAHSNMEGRKRFDDRLSVISDVAKEAGIAKLWNINWNYNMNSQVVTYDNEAPEIGVELSANGKYQIDTLENACKLTDALMKRHFQTTIEVNRSQKNNCNGPFQ